MKLRIRGNSVRLRLTRGELGQLLEAGEVREQVEFVDQTLIYALRRDAQGEQVVASFDGRTVLVSVPAQRIDRWANNDDEVSIDETLAVPNGEMRVLVEKDFACLQPRAGEDESDMFAHPQGDRLTC
ncbi:MAG: hypothetical protein AAFX85_17770 [Pseudomonadota bacterium]